MKYQVFYVKKYGITEIPDSEPIPFNSLYEALNYIFIRKDSRSCYIYNSLMTNYIKFI